MLLAMFNADSPLMATLDLDRELHWVHQYQLIEKTRFGAYVVGVLIFAGFFLNDGNVFVSGIFWALAAALLYLLRHIRTLGKECRGNIESLRNLESLPPFSVGGFVGLNTNPSGGEVLVGKVTSVVGTGGVATILSQPLRGVARTWVGDSQIRLKQGDEVFFLYPESDIGLNRPRVVRRLGSQRAMDLLSAGDRLPASEPPGLVEGSVSGSGQEHDEETDSSAHELQNL